MEKDFEKLVVTLKGNDVGSKDIEEITHAWEYAQKVHKNQKRLSGKPVAQHALKVARIVAHWKLDKNTIMAALLHDTIQEGGLTESELKKEFDKDVVKLVKGVKKITEYRLRGSKEKTYVENLRKMLLVMAKDVRVVLIKMADRLHNMQTLWALPEEKQLDNALETMEIYAPLAERLGIGEVKGNLEDLAFPYLYPKEYRKVKKESAKYYKKAEEHIKKLRRAILKKLAAEGIRANIHGRKKHIYSLWKKLERPGISGEFEKIHDIVALRIIVNETPECYVALGIVHDLYKPVPSIGISDFIAQPKPNGYRSIHTKVFGPNGRIVEVQIRTEKMHQEAEHGVAAHWAYSEEKSKGISEDKLEEEGVKVKKEKLNWVKQLVAWQKELKDSDEFLNAVKFDAFKERIFVFTPKGDVYDLPKGATPVDLAYTVHTGLGKYIKAAKVNGKIVPLNYKLSSGNVVEIVKSREKRQINRDWLEFVVTAAARREIKKSFK